MAVVVIAFAGVFSLGGLMVSQVNQLASDLPSYQSTLRDKIQSLRGVAAGTGTLERASEVLQNLSREIDRPDKVAPSSPVPGSVVLKPSDRPIPVEVRQPDAGALQTLAALISPLIHPLETTGIVVIFIIFILLQRQDLRNRLVRLAGSRDLQRTTAAIDDAAQRLSRLFLTQLALNAGFGVVIGAGLWFIGVPSAALWGMLAMVLRFVPYIGPPIAAIFPTRARGCGRDRMGNGALDRGVISGGRVRCRAGYRTGCVRSQHRPLACRNHCLSDVLDVAVGSDWAHSGDSADRVPGRVGTACGSL